MAGELVPLVLLPRYTTYAGAHDFLTIAMDVTAYSRAIVNVWRGDLIGTSPTIAFLFEESTDQVNWTACIDPATGNPMSSFDPGANAETQEDAELNKRWFRIKVTLGGTDPIGTCWAVGFLEERLS